MGYYDSSIWSVWLRVYQLSGLNPSVSAKKTNDGCFSVAPQRSMLMPRVSSIVTEERGGYFSAGVRKNPALILTNLNGGVRVVGLWP